MAVPYLEVEVNRDVIRVRYDKERPATMDRKIDNYIDEYQATEKGVALVRGPIKVPSR